MAGNGDSRFRPRNVPTDHQIARLIGLSLSRLSLTAPTAKAKSPLSSIARDFSDETERLMDHAIRGLVDQAFDRAVAILGAHRSAQEKTARLLLRKETLEDDIAALRAQIAPVEAIPIK